MQSIWELTPLNAGVPMHVRKSLISLAVSDIEWDAFPFYVTTVLLTINPHIPFPISTIRKSNKL